MVKRTPLRVISFVLLATCGALCQSEGPSGSLLQGLRFDGSNSFQAQRQEMPTLRSLPDAPSVQRAPQAGKFQTFVNEARSPLTLGAVAVNAAITRETDSEHVTPGARPGLTTLYKEALIQKESSAFFGKYLFPSLLKQDQRYYPSTSCTFLGRGHLRSFAHFYNAQGLRREDTEHVVFPRGADFGRYRHGLPPILGAIRFVDVQDFWLDDRQRCGDQPPPRVQA